MLWASPRRSGVGGTHGGCGCRGHCTALAAVAAPAAWRLCRRGDEPFVSTGYIRAPLPSFSAPQSRTGDGRTVRRRVMINPSQPGTSEGAGFPPLPRAGTAMVGGSTAAAARRSPLCGCRTFVPFDQNPNQIFHSMSETGRAFPSSREPTAAGVPPPARADEELRGLGPRLRGAAGGAGALGPVRSRLPFRLHTQRHRGAAAPAPDGIGRRQLPPEAISRNGLEAYACLWWSRLVTTPEEERSAGQARSVCPAVVAWRWGFKATPCQP